VNVNTLHAVGLRDPVAAGTHLLACAWAAYTALLLWRLAAGDRVRQWSVAVFGLSMVLLYGASGVYHALMLPEQRLRYYRLLDHSCIYILIAGTYTPIFAVLLDGRLRRWCLGAMWLMAAVGIACKWLLPWPPYGLNVALYIAMGWYGLLTFRPLVRAVGLRGMAWAMAGGMLYMAGGVADVLRWPVLYPHVFGPHETLHVLDMGGTAAHVIFVVRYIVPFQR
jgi:hemolysin III